MTIFVAFLCVLSTNTCSMPSNPYAFSTPRECAQYVAKFNREHLGPDVEFRCFRRQIQL